MALLYTLIKTKDEFIVEVLQISTFELFYISDNSNSKVDSGSLAISSPHTLITPQDGQYKLVLKATGESDIEKLIDVVKYLQDSIITQAKALLCTGTADCGCPEIDINCLSAASKKCLNSKSIFVKLLNFQSLQIPTYGPNYLNIFTSFISNGVETYECKAQTTMNNILKEECITGNVKSVDSLFNMYLALYWAGMYFIEENLAIGDEEQLEFLLTKFSYDTIVGCLCTTCIDIDTLKDLFTVDPTDLSIFSFQYDNISDDINDVAIITDEFLALNGEEHTEESLLDGKLIAYSQTGRVGFVIRNTLPDAYIIFDVLGNDITTSVFDKVYDGLTLEEIYVSKNYYTPSSIFYKFVKT